MRFIITLFMLSSMLFAYQQGDSLDQKISQKLNIEPNKVYVIDFFASWCASCKKELPLISKLNDKIDKNSVEIIGVDVDDDIKKAELFQKEMQLSFKVINDPKSDIIKVFDPVGMPAIYIIKDGKVSNLFLGAKDHIDEIIEMSLKSL